MKADDVRVTGYIRKTREMSPHTRIEILTPDFRGRLDRALDILKAAPPDVMNHNLETVPRLYRESRPGSDDAHSLSLLAEFKRRVPGVPTKSGLMVGLGETDDEILAVLRDMRAHGIDMLTIASTSRPRATTCRCGATFIRTPLRCSSARRGQWASRRRRWARWCARATTPTSRQRRPGSVADGRLALTPRRAAAVFLAFAFTYFFSALLRAVTATLAPVFSRELELGAADLGLLATSPCS